MPTNDYKPILTQPELLSQERIETSFPDRGLRLLARMIARELIRRHEKEKTRENIKDQRETTDNP